MQGKYALNVFLAGVLSAVLLVYTVARAICPVLVFPTASIPNLVLISVVTLLLKYYVIKRFDNNYAVIVPLTALTFFLLPMAAGLVGVFGALALAVKGTITFTVCTWLFTAMVGRIVSGPKAKLAPAMCALGLYLASQCLMGMF